MPSLGDGFILPLPLPWTRSGLPYLCQDTNFHSKSTPWNSWFLVISPETSLKNRGSWISPRGVHGNPLVTKNSDFAWDIPQKLLSRNCYFCLLHFFENIVNWALAYTRAQFSLFWKLIWSYFSATENTENCSFTCMRGSVYRCSRIKFKIILFFMFFRKTLFFRRFFKVLGLQKGPQGAAGTVPAPP